MAFSLFKSILPDQPVPTRIWSGPFRGARPVMNPRHSLRKALGLYEHELNGWLEEALRRVNRVLDVGANEGYFTFGCAAAFQRLGRAGEIVAIELQEQHMVKLREGCERHADPKVRFQLVQAYAGAEVKPGFVTLDSLSVEGPRENTLVKIDVEGAEVEVVEGARLWMDRSNLFVIEVHEERYLEMLRQTFAEHGHALRQINQQPLPLLGRELRDETNWWLVSDLKAN